MCFYIVLNDIILYTELSRICVFFSHSALFQHLSMRIYAAQFLNPLYRVILYEWILAYLSVFLPMNFQVDSRYLSVKANLQQTYFCLFICVFL
jgi:hypothetical protein